MAYEIDPLEREYADNLTAALAHRGRQATLARKDGLCDHGWRRGQPGGGLEPDEVQACLHCGKVASRQELDADAAEIYAAY